MKEKYTFKLDPELIEDLRKIAEKENRAFNNLVETVLKQFVKQNKKKK